MYIEKIDIIYLYISNSTSHALPTPIEIYSLMRVTLLYMFGLVSTPTTAPIATPIPPP